jgi:hypothetical protein
MFSSRGSTFGAPSTSSGPFGRTIGMAAAAIIIFAVGFYAGRSYPELFALSSPAPMTPVTAAEF